MNFDTIKKTEVWQCSKCKEVYLTYRPKCEICEIRQLGKDIRNGKYNTINENNSRILSFCND